MKTYNKLKPHYNYLGDELRQHFGQKIYKISLDAGFTCPTRDGSKGTKGCFYCGDTGSHYANIVKKLSITEQIEKGKQFLEKKYKVKKYIAYFQSYTSTYANLDILEGKLKESIADSDVVGLNLSTRPDCLNDEILDLLYKYMKPRYHWLEIGLESGHDEVLEKSGRGHSYQDFEDIYLKAKEKGFRICVHIILGLPGDTEEMMLATIKKLVDLKIDGIKLHNLHIIKNSVFEDEYNNGKIPLYSLEEYKKLIGKILQMLPSNIVIHRLTGEAPQDLLVAPEWSFNKRSALTEIDNYLESMSIFQGSRPAVL
jgi:uncharacterized protein